MSFLHSMGTSITQNLPGFVRQPAEALVGEKCYDSLVYNLNLGDVECIKHSLSKGLGLAMVAGGAILKLPQIGKILSSGSTRGLSLSAFVLETLAYFITTAYSYRLLFPFSQYGENLFLGISNVIIIALFFWYKQGGSQNLTGRNLGRGVGAGPDLKGVVGSVVGAGVVGAWLLSEGLCPPWMLSFLQAGTVPLTVLSKTPQILSNHRLRSTGNLSFFAVFNGFLGCAVRVFTTAQETGDALVWWGYFLAAVLNAVLVAQMAVYWKNSGSGSGGGGLGGEGDIPLTGLGYGDRKRE